MMIDVEVAIDLNKITDRIIQAVEVAGCKDCDHALACLVEGQVLLAYQLGAHSYVKEKENENEQT
jgi:hypothetical protein